MIKLSQAVIVEGKYDKIRLSNILDATIIPTDGFRIFKDREKLALIKILAEKSGIIIITDSDRAGQMIRKRVEASVPADRVTNVYLPRIVGKEKRKNAPSAEGVLGVEGTDDEIILAALNRVGITGDTAPKDGRSITKTDLFNLGLSGGVDSSAARKDFCKFLSLPDFLTANSLLDVLNSLFGYNDFLKEFNRWNQQQTKN